MAYLGNSNDSYIRDEYNYIAYANQTTFGVEYSVGAIDIFVLILIQRNKKKIHVVLCARLLSVQQQKLGKE